MHSQHGGAALANVALDALDGVHVALQALGVHREAGTSAQMGAVAANALAAEPGLEAQADGSAAVAAVNQRAKLTVGGADAALHVLDLAEDAAQASNISRRAGIALLEQLAAAAARKAQKGAEARVEGIACDSIAERALADPRGARGSGATPSLSARIWSVSQPTEV